MADEHVGDDLVLKLVLSLAVFLVQDPILTVVPVGIRDLVQALVLVQGCLSHHGLVLSPFPQVMAPSSTHSECSSLTSSGPVIDVSSGSASQSLGIRPGRTSSSPLLSVALSIWLGW